MTTSAGSSPWWVEGRAQALAGLFLNKLGGDFTVGMHGNVIGDYHIQFLDSTSNCIKSLMIDLKGSNGAPPNPWPFNAPERYLDSALARNSKVMLLVADVIEEKLFYGWLNTASGASDAGRNTVLVPLQSVEKESYDDIRKAVLDAPAT